MKTQMSFSVLLQRYFTDQLMKERGASGLTIVNYRDMFRLLLRFAERSLKKIPDRLNVADFDAPFILRFLDHLENERANSPRTRNVRPAAIHSFFTYVALQEPAVAAVAQRVLAIRDQTIRKSACGLFNGHRKCGLVEGARSKHLVWPTRSHPASFSATDGAARLRIDRFAL